VSGMRPVCFVRNVPGLYHPLGTLPHPPQSLESWGWACFGPQNLDVKELIGQNLDNKGLRGRHEACPQGTPAAI
jgi:hypothetical protein